MHTFDDRLFISTMMQLLSDRLFINKIIQSIVFFITYCALMIYMNTLIAQDYNLNILAPYLKVIKMFFCGIYEKNKTL